jgi:hypothetical protein
MISIRDRSQQGGCITPANRASLVHNCVYLQVWAALFSAHHILQAKARWSRNLRREVNEDPLPNLKEHIILSDYLLAQVKSKPEFFPARPS